MAFLLIIVFLFIASQATYAHYRHRHGTVLGDSTTSAQIPPTIDGPGFILPDSPLFFLDQVKQNVRVLMAFTPENKAKVHASIAGERLAELRFMLAKNNKEGVRIALQGVSDNFQKAADELSEAKLTGRNVSILAKKMNDDIKIKRQSLDILGIQTTGEMNAQVAAAQESVNEAKIKVEDSLPDDDLRNEIRDGINRGIEKEVNAASESAIELEEDLIDLKKEASEAAQKSLKRREEALREAIEEKNLELQRIEERRLEAEAKKQEKLVKAQEEAIVAARKAVNEAKIAAEKFKEAQEKIEEIRSE